MKHYQAMKKQEESNTGMQIWRNLKSKIGWNVTNGFKNKQLKKWLVEIPQIDLKIKKEIRRETTNGLKNKQLNGLHKWHKLILFKLKRKCNHLSALRVTTVHVYFRI